MKTPVARPRMRSRATVLRVLQVDENQTSAESLTSSELAGTSPGST